MVWNKQFLKTPLWENDRDKEAWNMCCDKGLPYAYFTKGRKYGEYCCDLLPVRDIGFSLTEEGTHEVAGMFEAFFARWYINKMLPKSKQVAYNNEGPSLIFISPCPVGEEVYVHYAMCRILAKHLQPSGIGNGVKDCGQMD